MHDDIEDDIHDVIKSQALNDFKPLLYDYMTFWMTFQMIFMMTLWMTFNLRLQFITK